VQHPRPLPAFGVSGCAGARRSAKHNLDLTGMNHDALDGAIDLVAHLLIAEPTDVVGWGLLCVPKIGFG